MTSNFSQLFSNPQPVIGVIHLLALPGAPRYAGKLNRIIDRALREAQIFNKHLDGIIIENFNDAPFYPDRVPAETIAAMTAISQMVVQTIDIPLGINVLRNDARAALAIATAVDAQFIRVNVHSHAVVADQGLIQGRAYETLRLRAALQSKVHIWADVQVKHAQPLAARSLAVETQDLTERGLVDGLIVSGLRTGAATSQQDVMLVKQHTHLPVWIGSGVNPSNLPQLQEADGFIVGSYFKKEGKVHQEVEEKRVQLLVQTLREKI